MSVEDRESYLQSLLNEVEKQRKKGAHGVYRVNAHISSETVSYLANYFHNRDGYLLDIKPCRGCKHVYTITLLFK